MNLTTPLKEVTRILPLQEKALKKLGLVTVRDLLYHFPVRYGDTSQKMNIGSLERGASVVVFGKITNLKTSKGFRSKVPMASGTIEDESGSIAVTWFHQAYLAKMIAEGSFVRAEGKVSQKKNGDLYLSNPKIETVGEIPLGVGNSLFTTEGNDNHTLYPVYPESRGITSNWIYHVIQKIFKSGLIDTLTDPIPDDMVKRYKLPTLHSALIWIHAPRKSDDALSARKRFSFEEIFFIQLRKLKDRAQWQREKSFVITENAKRLADFESRFPFPLTLAQRLAIDTILTDFHSGHPMSRLLEGDVGSGKTAVAAAAAYVVTMTRPFDVAQGKPQKFGTLQTAYMVPTEILAKQHFESFIQYFTYTGISIGLITGSGCRKFPSKVHPDGWTDISRTQLLKWVASDEISILIGTHALIQKSVKFKHLALAIIDEQHRFGTAQRAKLVEKTTQNVPHLLSMTATPIPRTLSLTLYGDLDLTLLDQMPIGRKPIITTLVFPHDREKTYDKIRIELRAGRQAYVICPRINEPDPDKENAIIAKSVVEEAKRLKRDIFPEYEIGILHSKMTPSEKEKIMLAFKDHELDILVATSVVEVGVNVPNATVIIIEGAERFGLAQLHQLRGRVLRGTHQPYCYVFTETNSKKSTDRLLALQKAANGFELAELDLKQRGAGELYSGKQWGISDLAMEAIQNMKMVVAARTEAKQIIAEDPNLDSYPLLAQRIAREEKIHFE